MERLEREKTGKSAAGILIMAWLNNLVRAILHMASVPAYTLKYWTLLVLYTLGLLCTAAVFRTLWDKARAWDAREATEARTRAAFVRAMTGGK